MAIRMIEKQTNCILRRDGSCVFGSDVAPYVYCLLYGNEYNKKYDNVHEIVVEQSCVLSVIKKLRDACIRVNLTKQADKDE